MVGSEKMLTVEVFVRWRDVDYMVDHGWITLLSHHLRILRGPDEFLLKYK